MMCEACERGDHQNCGMQTWCECDCMGPDGYDFGYNGVEGPMSDDENGDYWEETP